MQCLLFALDFGTLLYCIVLYFVCGCWWFAAVIRHCHCWQQAQVSDTLLPVSELTATLKALTVMMILMMQVTSRVTMTIL